MARYTGPKFKLSRRAGINVTGTTSPRLEKVLNIPPGRKPGNRGSVYKERLRAKQRVKDQYSMTEKQFRRFYELASKTAGPTGSNLLQLLERRLDNVVYRLGFARTRPMARQLVTHGHIEVNARRVNLPSFLVSRGDVIGLKPSSAEIPTVQEELVTRGLTASWLERDGASGRVTRKPRREDVEPDIREDLIVEFYSR